FSAPARAEKMHCPNVTDNDEKNTEIARKYFQMGGMYHDKQDFTKAAESFECVLKFIPYSLTARYKLARAYDAQGVFSLARENYEMILLLDSAEAGTLKPEIRKRLVEIKDLKDRVPVTAPVVEPAPADEKTCPPVVQKGQQDAVVKIAKIIEVKDWVKARTLLDETLKKLDGATPEQRRLCLSTDAGVQLLLLAGVAHFSMGNVHDAREAFLAVFRVRPDANLPVKNPDTKLLSFYQETLNAYFAVIAAEKERQLRIRELEEKGLIAIEPEGDPAVPVEHSPPANLAREKPLVFVCRVQDRLGAAKVSLVVRVDDGPAQEVPMEKLGKRRWVTVVPGTAVTFKKYAYYLVATDAAGSEVALWKSAQAPQELTLAAGKTVDKPVTPPVIPPVIPPGQKAPAKVKAGPRFFLQMAYNYETGFISKGMETELGAITTNAAWGDGPMFPSVELGIFLYGNHRISGGARLMIANYLNENLDVEDGDDLNFFLRWVRFFRTNGLIRPYAGAGVLGGPLRHDVENIDLQGASAEQDVDMNDSHQVKGIHFNAIGGAQLCLHRGCNVALQFEANWLWNVYSFDSESQADTMNNFAFWFSLGVAVMF
ncbi:hypothetical protein KKC22_14795, partial [Myxococcota bacterium]|nr:hypothetical protein [Myxococcota bacterium]